MVPVGSRRPQKQQKHIEVVYQARHLLSVDACNSFQSQRPRPNSTAITVPECTGAAKSQTDAHFREGPVAREPIKGTMNEIIRILDELIKPHKGTARIIAPFIRQPRKILKQCPGGASFPLFLFPTLGTLAVRGVVRALVITKPPSLLSPSPSVVRPVARACCVCLGSAGHIIRIHTGHSTQRTDQRSATSTSHGGVLSCLLTLHTADCGGRASSPNRHQPN